MSEKDKNIKKIIIPAMAIIITIVIIGTLVRYFTTQQSAQEVMVQVNEEQGLSDDYEVETEEEETKAEEVTEATAEESEVIEGYTVTIDTTTESASSETNDSINSTHTDIELSDNEYKGDDELNPDNIELDAETKAIADQVIADLMAEHPEWFTDTAPSTSTTQNPNYVHVDGTPSTGDLGDYVFGQGDYSEGAGGIVY